MMYAEEIIDDAKSTYSMDVDQTVDVDCSAYPDSDVITLWQWVVTSNDGESSVLTVHTVCRDYNKAPECPWNACLDNACIICASDWMA